MQQVRYENDIVTGVTRGVAGGGGLALPEDMADLPMERLRVVDGSVVDAADFVTFYLDGRGRKHVLQADAEWQRLDCAWDDDLVVVDGVWAVETSAHRAICEAMSAVGLGRIIPATMELIRARVCEVVDLRAGSAREAVGTPGYGQVEEYTRTEAAARGYLEAVAADPSADVADYPMLAAEMDAVESFTAVRPDATATATDIVAQADAWAKDLARIKTVRRAAKLRIQACADVDGIAAILEGLSWD